MQDILFVAFVAALNRVAGGGLGWEYLAHDHGGPVRGRPIYYVIVVLGALGLACGLGAVASVLIALSMATYRTPGWYRAIDGGTHDGTAVGDFVLMFARTLFAAPVFAWAAYEARSIAPMAVLFMAAALCAASYHIGNRAPAWALRFNPAEWMAGAVLGAAFWVAAGMAA